MSTFQVLQRFSGLLLSWRRRWPLNAPPVVARVRALGKDCLFSFQGSGGGPLIQASPLTLYLLYNLCTHMSRKNAEKIMLWRGLRRKIYGYAKIMPKNLRS